MKHFLIAAIFCFGLAAATANDLWERMKDQTGTITIADTIPGGDEAIKNLALVLGTENPKLAIEIRRCKLADALADLKSGKADLVLAYDEQLPSTERLRRRYAAEVALILVNAANPRSNFSSRELQAIFSGNLTDWSTLNGSGYSFHRLGAEPGAPAADVFQRKIMKDRPLAEAIYRKESADELLLLAATNPNTVAFLGIPNRDLGSAAVRDVSIDGIAPDEANLTAGKYPLMSYRVALMNQRPKPATIAFLQLLHTPEFSRLLREEWLRPL